MIDIKKIIINLENRADKLINCINQLRKINLDEYIIISKACNNEEAKNNMFENITKSAYENILNNYDKLKLTNYESVGRVISHKKCWQYIIDNRIENCLIIEDNIKVVNEKLFKFDFNEIKRFIHKKSDKPLYITLNAKQIRNGCFYEDNFDKLDNMFYGSNFYYINFKMARFLLNNIIKFEYNLDFEIGNLINKSSKKMNFYNFKSKAIVKNIKLKNDIKKIKTSMEILKKIFNFTDDIIYIIYSYLPIEDKLDRFEYLKYVNTKNNLTNTTTINTLTDINMLWDN